jgi:hypothetical protein
MLFYADGRRIRRSIGFFLEYVVEDLAPKADLTIVAYESIYVGEDEDMLETCESIDLDS